ncbi:MAG: acyltransferase [Alphaproteobacteria bacterium]|nr:acyltransferase [Alphaproteobacteria bacterium]
MMKLDADKHSINTLQVGRGMAALCVVLFHVNITLSLDKYLGQNIFPFFYAGGFAGVMYFFVLSGFVIYLAHHNDFNMTDGSRAALTRRFLWKRFQRIYPPIWAALLCVIPIGLFVFKNSLSFYAYISSALLLPIENDHVLDVLWTLRHEVMFYALFALCLWKPIWGIVLGTVWLAGSVVQPFLLPDYPWAFIVNHVHVLFIMGVAACWVYVHGQVKYPFVLLGLGAIIFASAWWISQDQHILNVAPLNLAYGIGATSMILGGAVYERRTALQLPRFLIFLGEASYSIYLVHFPVVSGWCKLAVHLNQMHIPVAILFFGGVIVAVGAGVVFHIMVEKPLMSVFKKRV